MELNWKEKTIVIVDDTKLNFVLLKTILRKTEANIVWLENGQEVIDYVKNLNVVDLILMDIRMPIIDGIEASKVIKKIAPQIPIIIQTASVMGEAYDDIKNSGCDDTIFKPIDSAKLINKIQNQLEKKSNK
ncbi:MAG: response regulator [Draconibacterium sp.]|nr:response regulator [Draconibacterium sp.]